MRHIKPYTTSITRAQWALTLVWWVVFVCLSQNAGAFNACSMNHGVVINEATTSTQSTSLTPNNDTTAMASSCELSEKLVQLSSSSWESATFTMWVFAFAIIAWLLSTSTFVPKRPEPIPPPRRLHLTFCVFRE
ncbi:hypothetical protein BCT30_21775 [Enterovibrio norvegicus]|nr:hypothetical protein BCU47_19885 [Enterovibrio norvegicus]PMI37843.1 hypothetical protein BCU46_09990 [Enterovibrio norvegicus]PMN46432.1 hypothetical protein BCT30_21775 [Enterovibrio norvegicus]